MEILNSTMLHPDIQKKVEQYVRNVWVLYGDTVKNIVIYGSSVGDNYIPKISSINIAVVVNDLSFANLKKSLKLVNQGIRDKIAAPLFLTEDYIKQSLDVFPIEFLDIKENHVNLYGQDVFENLEVQGEHIRLFCEQQIKGKLVRIRQAYLEIGLKKQGMEALLKESLNALIPIFRNLIRLKGKTPSVVTEEILTQCAQVYELDASLLLAIYKDTTNDEKIQGDDVEVALEKYLIELEKLAKTVDKI